MIDLTKGIWAELSGSALAAHIQDRLFKIDAEEGAQYPYAVCRVVSNMPEYPGLHTIEKYLIQFSLFSSKNGSTEIENMLTDLWTLYDDVVLTITGNTSIYFIRGHLVEMKEDHTTPSGTISVYHYAQDYDGWMTN